MPDLTLDHEDDRVGPKTSARSQQPVEVGVVGVADPHVAWRGGLIDKSQGDRWAKFCSKRGGLT